MILETPRLWLRPWEESDAPDLYRYAADPAVGPVAGWAPHQSVAESRQIIQEVLSGPEDYAIVPKAVGRPVGCIGLMCGQTSNLDLPAFEAELGYWIGVPFWGQGLVPEAAQELLRRGFEELKLERVWCGYFDGNEKSRRVQEKCGFRYHHTNPVAGCHIQGLYRVEHVSVLEASTWDAGKSLR